MKVTLQKVSVVSLLMTLGIVFGDIGTSPLYVFTAITQGTDFGPLLVMGSMSCIFWTLMLIATFKYIYLALNADNHGEGGIFALYALLRKTKSKGIIYPALIGCATLISDGFITPAISISSAVEGLDILYEGIPTLPIVCGILIALFLIQQFGTKKIGILFGPVMFIWFATLGILGLNQLLRNPDVLKAVNPMYAFEFLLQLGGGIKIPTGKYDKANNSGSVNPSFQLGNGSWDYILAMNYGFTYRNWGISTLLNYTIKTKNPKDYQFGNQLNYGINAFKTYFVSNSLALTPQLGLAGENYAANKEFDMEVANSKGNVFLGKISVEATYNQYSLSLIGMLPIDQNLNNNKVELKNRVSVYLNVNL